MSQRRPFSAPSGKPISTLTTPTRNSPKKFLQRYTGFNKPTAFLLFLSTTGIFAIFSLFNLFFSLPEDHSITPNPPGPLYWFHDGILAVVMRLHLWSVLRQ